MLVDTHCHFNSLSERIKARVFKSLDAGQIRLIDSSIDLDSSRASLELSKNHPFIYSALGFHPFSSLNFSSQLYREYQLFIQKNDKVIALGEVGLDYKADVPLSRQEEVLKGWLELAKAMNLPILIHNRLDKQNWYSSKESGRPRILALLDSYFSNYQNIVFHCFSYDLDFLKQIVQKGGFISFSLNLLRKNKVIAESFKNCPIENLFLETDSPYTRIGADFSTPLNIKDLYFYAASLKNMPEAELSRIILANARKVFKKII